MGAARLDPTWSPLKRVSFRFIFVYFLLYILPFPLTAVPFAGPVVRHYFDLWREIVVWVGQALFGVDITIFPAGSGDTTFNYVQVFCYFSIALVTATLWTLVDRRRPQYSLLHRGLRVYVRYNLAYFMILYGSVKVIKAQFPYPSLDRLVQPFGDASPMGLLWTFMGASEGYNMFSGGGEMLGGLLLTTRRTTLLGALVSIGVLGHVAALNFCYDVPVKLFSIHLLAMAIILTLPDLRRLADFFLFNRPAQPADIRPVAPWPVLRVALVSLRTILVAAFVVWMLFQAHRSQQTFGDLAAKSPLFGIWIVDDYEVDGKAHPPLITDAGRWRRVIFDYPQMLSIQLMSDSRQRYNLKLDDEKKTLALSKRDEPKWSATLTYHETPGYLALEGAFDGHNLRAKLHRADEREFLLLSRGFHWINEFPFNR